MEIKNRFTGAKIGEFAIECGANLSRADLGGADLGGADLGDANLSRANLCGADLGGADLGDANLSGANLRGANLCGANLSRASLCYANLSRANLGDAKYNVLNVLKANFKGDISPGLCTAMMAFDRDTHPYPDSFKVWAKGGDCPLNSSNIERALIFDESRECYNHSLASPTPWQLWEMVAREFEIETGD